jgi:NAD(P)-dependent dehydrogenase (short-subunit alcohol dehydrogenase family)
VSRIFITGSADGLGAAAAQSLMDDGHAVALHARSAERAAEIADSAARAAGVVVGDLSRAADVRTIAEQVNAIGRMDAVIHNAGVYQLASRGETPEGHATTLAVNTLAPYMLTALIERPARLVYLSSGLHRGGEGSLADLDWTARPWSGAKAYAETKLHAVALAALVARRWPDAVASSVDPGWVRTKMGGPSAPVDLATGARTQAWLASTDEPAALVSGGYWNNRRQQTPAAEALDPAFQDALAEKLAGLTGVTLL